MIGYKVIHYLDDPIDVISLDNIKAHANIVRTDQDTDIETKLTAAVDWCSEHLGYSLRRATVDYYYGKVIPNVAGVTVLNNELYIGEYLRIPANVLSITAVYYRDGDDTEQTLAASDWEFINMGEHIPKVRIVSQPSLSDYGYAYRIRATVGWYTAEQDSQANAEDVIPYSIVSAIQMRFTALYENRNDENVAKMHTLSHGALAFLTPYMKLQIL